MSVERTKVLFLAPNFMGGGAERVFATLLGLLDRRRFEPQLALLQAKGPYLAELPKDVVVHDLRVSRVRYGLPAIVRLVWSVRPQTVISTFRTLNLLLIMAKPLLPRNTRLLVRESSMPTAVLAENGGSSKTMRRLYRHLYKRADKIVALSDAMVSDLVENFRVPREKVVRIYNPVDTRRVGELAQLGPDPYAGPGPHLVAAGRLVHVKGFDILLAALPAVVRRFPAAELIILGDGPLRTELVTQARERGLLRNVLFPGFVPNPWRYFRHADVFILPSRHESFGNVILEALALDTPVVAADCPSALREFQECLPGITLVPPENPEALAQAIVKLCSESSTSRRECPRADLSRFDVQQIVKEYSRVL
jgi:glycosyltransferase involved in cell wall biosynthesis